MYYAVIQRPEAETTAIREISREYDPNFGLVGPHVTLVFPVPSEKISEDQIIKHIGDVAQASKPFPVHLSDLELSWDQWLFLTPKEGRSNFDDLHDALYTGPLEPMLRADIPFVPHIALGHFAVADSGYSLKDPKAVPLDTNKYDEARQKIAKLGLDYSYTAHKIELIAVNDEFTESRTIAEFELTA